jgi:2-succinyl-5-enolpyruvyl-6-hydroxy-3-cyclohexene-1-carboxylate synthase
MTGEADVALACISALLDGLVSAGVRHAALSPGSRSTPLALALARHPLVEVHVHLDERSSAFFALGLAKASGAPVVVACTSGTAAANLFPAVVEASMARVPLVLLTADRPPELRGVGANQTIDQIELFGRYARAFVDAPVPADARSQAGWRTRGADAAETAARRPSGPVHLNLPFREPLVPSDHYAGRSSRDAGAVGRDAVPSGASTRPSPAEQLGVASPDLGPILDVVSSAERGLVYAGELRAGGEDVVEVAKTIGWPLVAEPHSGARRPGALGGGGFLLECDPFMEAHVPDAVLQFGAAPTSRAALELVGRAARLVIVDPDDVVADPLRRASARVVVDPADLRSVVDGVGARAHHTWAGAWRSASDRARGAVDALVDAWTEPFEGRVARDVADTMPPGSDLCVGSSLPIRDLDRFMRPRGDVRIIANRGASGIDGFVSTTLGVAAASRPTVGLLGDLTFVHDVGALVWNAGRGADVVLVVLNNGGGAIFSLLEQRDLPEIDLFTTPHGVDLGAVVRAARASHACISRAADVVPAIAAAREAGGLHVVEVIIDPARDRRRRIYIRQTVEKALT